MVILSRKKERIKRLKILVKNAIKQLTYHGFCDKLYKHVFRKYMQSHR